MAYKIKHPDVPLLHVGNPARTIYWPLELCEIKKQASPSCKKLSEDQAANMVRKSSIPPKDRKARILSNLREIANGYKDDPYSKAFGISVDDKMKRISGRILQVSNRNPPISFFPHYIPKSIFYIRASFQPEIRSFFGKFIPKARALRECRLTVAIHRETTYITFSNGNGDSFRHSFFFHILRAHLLRAG